MRPFALLTALLLGTGLLAQSPEAFNYQGVARDAGGDALANTAIGVQFQLHQGTAVGTVVYSETHSPTTNDLGLFSLEVGNGTPGTGTFAAIDWSAGPYFLEVGMDPAGGSSYTSVGAQQLLSVPYALHAKTAEMADDGDWVLSGDTVHSNGRRVGIGTTTPSQDLDVEGTFQLKDGTQADKKILTSDAEGNASWQELGAESLFGAGNLPPAYGNDISCLSTAGSLSLASSPRSVAVSGNYAYVVDFFSDDLKVIDISDPAAPVLAGSVGIGPLPFSVAVSGNYAYVVDINSDDLKVVNISIPGNPVISGSLGVGGSPVSVAISGNYAYVVDTDSKDLKVIDISNPASPTQSGGLGIGFFPSSVAVSGNYAYVVDLNSEDLKVIDITNPAAPALAGSLGLGANPRSVAVSGSYAYVVDDVSEDLKVIDISDPASPTLSGSLGIGPLPFAVAVSGTHAYVVDQLWDDLEVIDISNPAAPTLASSLSIGTEPIAVAVSGNYAYIVDTGTDDLRVIELFCPAEQQQVIYDPATGSFGSAPQIWQTSGDSVYVADQRVGIGTTAPSAQLDVRDASASELRLSLSSTHWSKLRFSSTEGLRIEAKNEGVEFRPMLLIGSEVKFYSGLGSTPERMRLASNGFLGIGTNSPANRLDVEGGLAVGASYSGTNPAPTNGVIIEGNVGIGTSSPANRLDVEGGMAVGASYSGSSPAPANGAIVQGSVGIGTTAPEYTLHISNGANTGSGSFGRGLKITDVTPRIYFEESDAAVNEKLMFLEKIEDGISFSSVIDNATLFRNQHILFVKGSGSVGVGTKAPTAKLSVNGTANNSTGSWGVFSDARIKTVQREFTDGLSVIDRMRPVVFTYNADAPFQAVGEQVGIIAQELEELAPYMVSTTEHGDIHDLREVNNQAYVFLLINAVKELKAENDRLKTDNVVQQEQLEANTRALEELKALVGAYAGR